MASKDIFNKYKDVLAVVRIEDGKVIIDSDDTKIDEIGLVVIFNEVIAQYLQSNQVQE